MQLPNMLHYVGMMRRNRWVIGMYFSLVYTFVCWFYTHDIEGTLYSMARQWWYVDVGWLISIINKRLHGAPDVNWWSKFWTNLQEQSKQ